MPLDSKGFPTDCWSYEYRDGGGPWFRPDGEARAPNNIPANEDGNN